MHVPEWNPRKYYYKAEQNIFPVSRDASVSELLL